MERDITSEIKSVAIIGASLAGARVAEALRSRGFEGRILLVGREPYLPYERPALSKTFLTNDAEVGALYLRSAEGWASLDVQFVLGDEAAALSPSNGGITLRSGRLLQADRVVLCTGGTSRRANLPGESLRGVHHLRTVDDALALAERLAERPAVAIVGGGFIGAELASTAAQLGCSVSILESGSTLMLRGLGQRWGHFMVEEHQRRGVDVRLGVGVREIVGGDTTQGVRLVDGAVVDADLVVVAVGMVPATEVGVAAGLVESAGIVVDDFGRTSHPNVFAAGDVTAAPRWRAPGWTRYESVRHAEHQANAVAAALLDQPEPRREAPWFWSDQFDYNIQFAGSLLDPADVLVRSCGESTFVAFHVQGRQIQGVLGINRGRDVRAAMRLIDAQTEVDPDALTDASVDLRRLVAVGTD